MGSVKSENVSSIVNDFEGYIDKVINESIENRQDEMNNSQNETNQKGVSTEQTVVEQTAKLFTEDPTSFLKGGSDLNAAAVEAADNPNHERVETENTPQERNPDIRKVAKSRLGAGASIINAVPGHAYRGNVLAVIDNGPNKVVAMATPADQDLIVVHEVPNDKAADLKAGVKAELTMGKDSLSAAPGRDSQEREHKQFKGR